LKIKNLILFLFLSAVFLTFNFCTTDNTTNPPEQNLKNYYPGLKGTTYKYEILQKDSAAQLNNAERFVGYGDEVEIESVKYREQKDSVNDGSTVTEYVNYFRKTPTGVFYFIDTTGFLSLVPDSVRNLISIQDEMRLFLNPLDAGSFWPVFRVTLNLQPGFSINPIDINGYFIASEDLTLNLESGVTEIKAEKVKYDLDILTDLNQTVRRFSAYAWFTEEIGIVKLDGNNVVINILLNGEINLSDTTAVLIHNLIDYDIK
jgi:hypothetical protein